VDLLARVGVPHLARAVVTPRDELVAALVERAVGQRQDVRAQHLEQPKVFVLHVAQLVLQLVDELAQRLPVALLYHRLLPHDLIQKHLRVRLARQVQQIHAALHQLPHVLYL
jgi:AcrR family transcriptional regulator